MWGDSAWFAIGILASLAGIGALLLGLIGIFLKGKDGQ